MADRNRSDDLILSRNVAYALDARTLKLILMPTEQCNFRCFYCYEDFELGKMAPHVVEGVRNLISERGRDLDCLNIDWFGGEPLLAKKLIYEMSQFVISESRRLSFDYAAEITTNGYLLDEATLDRLVECKVTTFQISLDGPPEIHDRTRVTRRGKGSFERIWRNMMAIRRSTHDVTVIVRVHYQYETYMELTPLIRLIDRELGGDPRFRIYFKAVNPLGGPNHDKIHRFSETEKTMIEQALSEMLDNPAQEYEGGLNDTEFVCYAAAANSFVVRANGDINKCTVALNSDKNLIGRLNSDGTLDIEQEKFRNWIGALFSGDRQMMACPYPYVLGFK